ncbi:unnamed protein product [Durusdinium trenchii]|uniref:SAC3/GANP/THP3 conserved domain-containing protein n=1 Tax=Durusdinium trenchii TaxID=1381693 RepID=A0ABP0P354_9DINO
MVVGSLREKCSAEEAQSRQRERLLDPLEWRKGCSLQRPEVDFSLATKKYQRSSAGKEFLPEEVRPPDICLETMDFLMDSVLDADDAQDGLDGLFAVTPSLPQIYSYLHDRCRAVRMDLHLQQPWSSRTQEFVTCHEYCLRFEALSRFLFSQRLKTTNAQRGDAGATPSDHYDERLGLQAISQTIDPLLAAYQQAREEGTPFENEPFVQRLVILLLLATSPDALPAHLAALDRRLVGHPLVREAIEATGHFLSGHYVRFLRFAASDLWASLVLVDLADLARVRLLWLRARAYHKAVGDRWPLKQLAKLLVCDAELLRHLLVTYKVEVVEEPEAEAVLPRKGAWEDHPLFCEFPQTAGPFASHAHLWRSHRLSVARRRDAVKGLMDPTEHGAEKKGMRQF